MSERQRNPQLEALLKKRGASAVAAGAISTYQRDQPIERIRPDEILDVNWSRIKRELGDIITRIQNEGELDTEDIAEAILLTTIALRSLSEEEENVANRLRALPESNFITSLLALLPTDFGRQAKQIIANETEVKRENQAVKRLVAEIADVRFALAKAVDQGVDRKLIHENSAYRALDDEYKKWGVVLEPAERIFRDIEIVINRDLGYFDIDVKSSISSWVAFYQEQGCTPKLRQVSVDLMYTPQDLAPGISALIQNGRQEMTRLNQRMQYMRDQMKAGIYSKARRGEGEQGSE